MLRIDAQTIRVTPAGMLQVDSLLPEFYDPEFRNARYT